LIALYLPEPSSSGARALVDRLAQPILVNELQEFEFKNSVRQKVVRKEVTEADLVRCLRVFQDDCVMGKIQRKSVAWSAIYAEAEKISRRLAVKQVCRSFDLLHVAIAVVSAVKHFATLDLQQAAFARTARLRVVEVPPP
jgi:predicted nucleic acid-binding protein